MRSAPGMVVVVLVAVLAGCGSGGSGEAARPTTTAVASPSPVGSAASRTPASGTTSASTGEGTSSTGTPATGPPATGTAAGYNGATAAPNWLGLRVLPIGPDGYGKASSTPKDLRPRKIITVDFLPPPADGRFHSRIQAVSKAVAERTTWSKGCPVSLNQLRYVTVSFVGFDGRAHTGELLVNRSVASDVVTAFGALFRARWPIEEMRITNNADLNAPITGDGNDTSAFVCRPVRGATVWSQHAYGLAVDVNPFQNPYISGSTVLPELARYYTDRGRGKPGMNTPKSAAVKAFRSIGWGWGGDYRTKKDWMHFSSTGG